MALVIAPIPAGARSAPQANSTKGSTEFTTAMPRMRSHTPAPNCARACHRNGMSVSAPSASRASTRGSELKSLAATRMKRNEPPQIAPSSVSSMIVRSRPLAADAALPPAAPPAALSAAAPSAELDAGAGMGALVYVRGRSPALLFARRAALCGPALSLAQRLLQILHEVLGRLDSHRQSQQPVADAEPQPLIARQARVRGGRRTREQRVHAAEARRNDRQAHARGELIGLRRAAVQLEAQQAAAA